MTATNSPPLPSLYPLDPNVQHYSWGGTSFISGLLRRENPEGRPFAELWMGAHPALPSFVRTNGVGSLGLDALIAQNPESYLGHETARDFGGLPYLLKVLDVAKPLSIQVHPGRDQACAGYDDEEGRNVSRLAPFRNYKDPFPKPELVTALEGPFWVLAGFLPVAEIGRFLSVHPELGSLSVDFMPTLDGLKTLYKRIMSAPPEELERLLCPLLDRWKRENSQTPFSKEDPRYWAVKASALYSSSRGVDRGVLSIPLMNLVKLNPGDSLFLPSGVLHAFLEGIALEISANSDNVFRGGLTHKHVDVPELLKTVVFDGMVPDIRRSIDTAEEESIDLTPAKEFELRRLRLRQGDARVVASSWGSRIFFVAPGSADVSVDVETEQGRMTFQSGESFFVPRGGSGVFRSSADAVVFQAGTPPVDTFHGQRPTTLAFGTSGLRGRITDITDLEAYVNTRGFMRYVEGKDGRGIPRTVSIGMDLRPSSPRIAEAVARAVRAEGGSVENLGRLPSPALMSYACERKQPSVMVTGSHIPFDRNGIKFNLAAGEVLKEDESKILTCVRECRAEEYNRPAGESLFDDRGFFKRESEGALPTESQAARDAYLRRSLDFFPAGGLRGMRIVVYQHSAVGRDLLVEVLRRFGAQVLPLGRSEEFVPIDTEDISEERLGDLQGLANDAVSSGGPIDALVSTDGDSDRPLVCGMDSHGALTFFPGDMVGPLVAEYLDADGVVVPVSANDGVDEFLRGKVLPRTKIGSPFVIEGMRFAEENRTRVVGYEANGGFLVQNEIIKEGRRLAPLPTRDAILPILCVLFSARERGLPLVQLFDRLPRRFTKAGLLDHFPLDLAGRVLRFYSPLDPRLKEVDFAPGGEVSARDAQGHSIPLDAKTASSLREVRRKLEIIFHDKIGFVGGVVQISCLDGLRLRFGNRDVAHVRPSGNAPQLRIYACANTPIRAQEIVQMGLHKPHRLLSALAEGVQGNGQ